MLMCISEHHFCFNKKLILHGWCFITGYTETHTHTHRLKLDVYLCYPEVRVNGGQLLAAACISAMLSLCCIWVKALKRNWECNHFGYYGGDVLLVIMMRSEKQPSQINFILKNEPMLFKFIYKFRYKVHAHWHTFYSCSNPYFYIKNWSKDCNVKCGACSEEPKVNCHTTLQFPSALDDFSIFQQNCFPSHWSCFQQVFLTKGSDTCDLSITIGEAKNVSN